MKKILVLCTGNSCRSQIAEGYLRVFAEGKAEIYSAGIETHGVNPDAIAIMKADGIELATHTSNNVIEYKEISFDFILTVCDHALEQCPVFPSSAMKFHSNFPDPSKFQGTQIQIKNEYLRVRNLIKVYCKRFVEDHL